MTTKTIKNERTLGNVAVAAKVYCIPSYIGQVLYSTCIATVCESVNFDFNLLRIMNRVEDSKTNKKNKRMNERKKRTKWWRRNRTYQVKQSKANQNETIQHNHFGCLFGFILNRLKCSMLVV